MTVTSQRPALVDLVRTSAVALLAVVQAVVAGFGGSGAAGESVGVVAERYATPLLAAGWAFAIWGPIYLGFLAYAGYQLLPSQRSRSVHRRTGWWLAGSAACNAGWILSFAAGWLPLAELLRVGLLLSLAVAFGRLSHEPAGALTERALLRVPVALYTGWVSVATVLGTAATGVWFGLPGSGALATIAAVVVLLVATAIVAWVIVSGTAVVAYAAAVVWALVGIALNEPPAAVVVAAGCAAVVVVVVAARRVGNAADPKRAAWG